MIEKTVLVIFYVKNQNESRDFYKKVLALSPVLDVPGMTEFKISDSFILGLMPEKGIEKIIGDGNAGSFQKNIPSRCELYLSVDNPEAYCNTAVSAGGKLLSAPEKRGWGDIAGYCADPDGHVIAFAVRAPL